MYVTRHTSGPPSFRGATRQIGNMLYGWLGELLAYISHFHWCHAPERRNLWPGGFTSEPYAMLSQPPSHETLLEHSWAWSEASKCAGRVRPAALEVQTR